MPCTFITAGRSVSCKDTVAGIEAVYFQDYTDVPLGTGYAVDGDGFITTIATTPAVTTAFKYALRKERCKLDITVQADGNTGTTSFEQRVTLSFNKLNKTDADNIKLLAYNRPQIWVLLNQGDIMLLGARNGMDMENSTMTSGQAWGDTNGFELTFVGKETDYASWGLISDGITETQYPFDNVAGMEVTV